MLFPLFSRKATADRRLCKQIASRIAAKLVPTLENSCHVVIERCGLCHFGENSHGLSYKLSYAGPFGCFYTERTQFHFPPFIEKDDWKVSDSGVAVSTFGSLFGEIVCVGKRF